MASIVSIKYLGHSCFLITSPKAKILIDPFLTGNPKAAAKAEDVECDFILVSHVHAGSQGAKVLPLGCGGGKDFSFGRVQLTIAHHTSSVEGPSGPVMLGSPVGFLFRIEGKTIYFAGDTALTMDMQLLGERKQIDLAMLPIGDHFTMGMEDAAEAVRMLKPKLTVPMHYNTFEAIQVDPRVFVREAGKHGYQVEVMQPGASINL
jgi:L-ascorbate metabolism protein UlaG (beta-lactamase superfamily)